MKAIIHIGTHKTGSTSLQHYLNDSRDSLAEQGFDLYRSPESDTNHVDLYLATLDPRVDTFARDKNSPRRGPAYYEKTKENVHRFVSETRHENLIFTAEGLSLLRSVEECQALKALFPETVTEFQIICLMRDKKDFLASYRRQLLKKPGRRPSWNPRSALYVRNNTWLTRFDEMIVPYITVFGKMTVLHYDPNDTLPRICQEIGIAPPETSYRRNVHKSRGKS